MKKYDIIICLGVTALLVISFYLGYLYGDSTTSTERLLQKSNNYVREQNNDEINWFDARWETPDLGVSQYKGEELEYLDRSQFVDILELPYGIYMDINTNEIIMNLDDVFKFVDMDSNPSFVKDGQKYVDDDYINLYCGDYGHHATKLFLSYFFNFDKADKIIVGERVLKFDHYDTADAPIESWEVFNDEDGKEQHSDERIEFIACIYNPDLEVADRRFVAYMEEIN